MSIVSILKKWTLPVSILTGVSGYLFFALIPAFESFAVLMDPVFERLLPVFMFGVLFVTFCKVDFRRMRPVRWHLWIALSQLACVGALMLLIIGGGLEGRTLVLAEAMLTCVISPCASAAPVVTQKLGGNLEEMTTYMFMSNFITALAVPLCFPMMGGHCDMRFITAFTLILYKVCAILVLPMVLAHIVKRWMPRLCSRIVSIKDLSFYLWGCSLVIVSGTTMKNIVNASVSVGFLLAIAVFALVLCLCQFACGRMIGRRFGQKTNAGQALGQKNTAFAIWMACAYLTPLSSVGPGCYILWQNIINSREIWKAQKRAQGTVSR